MSKTQKSSNEAVASDTTSAAAAGPSPKEAFVLAQPESLPVKDLIAKAKDAGLEISESYAYKIRRTAAAKAKGTAAPKGKPGRKPGSKNAPKPAKAAAAAPAKPAKAAPAKAAKAAPAKPAKAAKAAPAKPAKAAAKPAKAAAPAATSTKLTVKEFVLSLPLETPAADVVAKGAELGLKMRTGYVHEIRSAARRAEGKPAATGARRGRPPKSASAAPKAAAAPAAAPAPVVASSGDEASFRRLIVLLGPAKAEELLADVRHRLDDLYAGR